MSENILVHGMNLCWDCSTPITRAHLAAVTFHHSCATLCSWATSCCYAVKAMGAYVLVHLELRPSCARALFASSRIAVRKYTAITVVRRSYI